MGGLRDAATRVKIRASERSLTQKKSEEHAS